MPYLSKNYTLAFAKCRCYTVFTAKSVEIAGIYTVLADKYASEHSANTQSNIMTDF